MAKIGLIIFILFVGILLGTIAQQEVCKTAEQDLGTGKPIMKAMCLILSIPTDLVLLLLLLTGIVIYFIVKSLR